MDPAPNDPASPTLHSGAGRVTHRALVRIGVDQSAPEVLRPASFDPTQARRAWRQFARARGAVPWERDAQPRRWGPWLFLALGIAAAAVVYQTRSTRSGPVAPAARQADAAPAPPAPPAPSSTAPAEPTPHVASAGLARSAPSAPAVDASPYVPRLREPPRGTAPDDAAALTKVPRSSKDRAPVGGVGVHGIHIDRIVVASRSEDGSCRDAKRDFSITGDRSVQVCFRVVHQRQAQRLVVRWVRAGELVRRTFLSVPADHAYRTRAWMPLTGRSNLDGSWTAIVQTEGGVELARERFAVAR